MRERGEESGSRAVTGYLPFPATFGLTSQDRAGKSTEWPTYDATDGRYTVQTTPASSLTAVTLDLHKAREGAAPGLEVQG
ncbi:hypothetical protein J6590_010290 [Homalodisca vitripennis]|nr:hypothetical protein J6590_010290 [Homalodisca vitripennis]